jgi:hypothetical protein
VCEIPILLFLEQTHCAQNLMYLYSRVDTKGIACIMLIVSVRAGSDVLQQSPVPPGSRRKFNSIMERQHGSEERTQGSKEGRTQGREEGRTQGRKKGRTQGCEEAPLAVGQLSWLN